MLKLIFEGYEIGGSVHDVSENEWRQLSQLELNLENITQIIDEYDRWSTNFFELSRPLIDASLTIKVIDNENSNLWSGNCDSLCDIYEHADNFPELEKIENWDEPDQPGDAIAYEEHPFILYYEELNKGVVGICNIESETFDPKHLSIVEGCLETDDTEWMYINKIYYRGKPLKFEPIEHDLKHISSKFKLLSEQ